MRRQPTPEEVRSFQYVGAYLSAFAGMEDKLNSAIERVFDLTAPTAALQEAQRGASCDLSRV